MLTDQAFECLDLLKNSDKTHRTIGVVRVLGNIRYLEKEMRMSKYQHVKKDYNLKMFLWRNYNTEIIFVDSKNGVRWDDSSYCDH